MALSPQHQLRNKQIVETLRYFDKFDYPLTYGELIFWQSRTGSHPVRAQGFYFLPGRSHIVKLRLQRAKFSQVKWQIAQRVGEKLKKFPFIAAVFVTGALAMNNCPEDDDIDLMIVAYPNTLWITRFFLNLYLFQTRRYPGQITAPDKICPNLWLDTNHLRVTPWVASDAQGVTLFNRNMYLAHEICQAKVLWDRAGVHQNFLLQNSWVKDFLPAAYKSQIPNPKSQIPNNSQFSILNFILYPLNAILFALQYLYMKPKMTTERVGLGFAFFHPRG